MRSLLFLAAIVTLTATGCSSFGPKRNVQPSQSQTIRVPEAYPSRSAAAQGLEVGSDSQVARNPNSRRTTVRR
jgi:hypothetical protein